MHFTPGGQVVIEKVFTNPHKHLADFLGLICIFFHPKAPQIVISETQTDLVY